MQVTSSAGERWIRAILEASCAGSIGPQASSGLATCMMPTIEPTINGPKSASSERKTVVVLLEYSCKGPTMVFSSQPKRVLHKAHSGDGGLDGWNSEECSEHDAEQERRA